MVLFIWWIVILFFHDFCLWMCFATGLCDLIASNSLFFMRLLHMIFWSFSTFTLLDHANTCTLVTEPVSFSYVSSCIISSIMPSSFKPLMNCYFRCLSNSLHLHSVALSTNPFFSIFVILPTKLTIL